MSGNGYVLSMTEQQLADLIIELAGYRGWKVVHFRPARTARGWRTPVQGDSGSPDLLLARRGQVILAELKKERGKMRADQQEWAEAIGAQHRLWRPSDLEQIKKELA